MQRSEFEPQTPCYNTLKCEFLGKLKRKKNLHIGTNSI